MHQVAVVATARLYHIRCTGRFRAVLPAAFILCRLVNGLGVKGDVVGPREGCLALITVQTSVNLFCLEYHRW